MQIKTGIPILEKYISLASLQFQCYQVDGDPIGLVVLYIRSSRGYKDIIQYKYLINGKVLRLLLCGIIIQHWTLLLVTIGEDGYGLWGCCKAAPRRAL